MRKHICILLGSGWFLKTSNLRSRLTQKLLRVSKNSEVPMEIKNKQTKTAQKGCCHIPSPLKDSIYRPWKLTVIIFIKHEEKILAFLPAHFFLACVWTWCLEVQHFMITILEGKAKNSAGMLGLTSLSYRTISAATYL